MPLFLPQRNPELVEWMDRTDCSLKRLKNTYRYFSLINKLLSGWKGVYRKEIKPLIEEQGGKATLLDVGFGGGDIPLNINRWARNDGFDLQITAIETDQRAVEHVSESGQVDGLTFRHCSTADLLKEGRNFDIVISNHLIHHLNDAEVRHLLDECDQLAKSRVIFNDIKRSDFGFLLFYLFALPAHFSSYIWMDGLISIRRSFTLEEIRSLLPGGWKASGLFPFRLLIRKEMEHA
jgi:2-polyprenyl-3-methyl-5-hydroxy-6-metoxy-1,4-benzoquinol methylase